MGDVGVGSLDLSEEATKTGGKKRTMKGREFLV